MKIALVSQEYPPETARGGISTQTYVKAKGLSDLGHEVFVISRSINLQRNEYKDGNINVIRIHGMENHLSEMTDIVQWITHSTGVATEIERLNKYIGLDIIDFPEWAAEGYIYLLNRTSWNTIPVVIQLHGPLVMFAHTMGWPEVDSEFYRIGTQMEATCINLADAVYSSSKCSSSWIYSHYSSSKEYIPTIHLGVDTTKFAPQLVSKNEQPTIIFIGRIVQNKGIEELVEAASLIVKDIPDLQLKIIGRGEEAYINKLLKIAHKAGAQNLLDFTGYIQKEALPEVLSKAHLFAAPSWYEGGPGFVYLEAMACGIPVIGCTGSGVEEIVTSGENGILVPPKNVKALGNALRKILSDQKLQEEMSIKARDFILQEADSSVCLRRLENFYKEVLNLN